VSLRSLLFFPAAPRRGISVAPFDTCSFLPSSPLTQGWLSRLSSFFFSARRPIFRKSPLFTPRFPSDCLLDLTSFRERTLRNFSSQRSLEPSPEMSFLPGPAGSEVDCSRPFLRDFSANSRCVALLPCRFVFAFEDRQFLNSASPTPRTSFHLASDRNRSGRSFFSNVFSPLCLLRRREFASPPLFKNKCRR